MSLNPPLYPLAVDPAHLIQAFRLGRGLGPTPFRAAPAGGWGVNPAHRPARGVSSP